MFVSGTISVGGGAISGCYGWWGQALESIVRTTTFTAQYHFGASLIPAPDGPHVRCPGYPSYVDFTPTGSSCFANVASCTEGVTIRVALTFLKLEENAMFFSSGAEVEDGTGFAVFYRYGAVNVVAKTVEREYSVRLSSVRTMFTQTLCMSLSAGAGLEVDVDGKLEGTDKNGVNRLIPGDTEKVNTVYCGRPTEEVTHYRYSEVVVGQMDVFYAARTELLEEEVLIPGATCVTVKTMAI